MEKTLRIAKEKKPARTREAVIKVNTPAPVTTPPAAPLERKRVSFISDDDSEF